jgi:hypothetical protein
MLIKPELQEWDRAWHHQAEWQVHTILSVPSQQKLEKCMLTPRQHTGWVAAHVLGCACWPALDSL